MKCRGAPNVHLCPCHGLGPLWLFLSVTEQTALMFPGSTHPPSHHHHSPHPLLPIHPLNTTLLILQKVFNNLSKTSYGTDLTQHRTRAQVLGYHLQSAQTRSSVSLNGLVLGLELELERKLESMAHR